MTSQTGQQIITITTRILPNISRSKRNQTMKFGQLIEYNMRNTFLENAYPFVPNCRREGGRIKCKSWKIIKIS